MDPAQIELEQTARRSFALKAAEIRHMFVISGEEGLARVPSQKYPGREVTLFWSSEAEAQCWLDVLGTHPRIKMLPLTDVLSEVLPKLAELKRLAGTGWNDVPVEAEMEPMELVRQIRLATIDHFVMKALDTKAVWMLQGADGPALHMSLNGGTGHVLPVWADRAAAESRIEGPWSEMEAVRVPLSDFRQRTLLWVAETRRKVAPAFCEGAGGIEIEPWELKGRFNAVVSGEQAVA